MKSKKEKKSYDVFAVLKRMLGHMWQEDKGQFGRVSVYTVLGAVFPFLSILLPKLAIGILEQGGEDAAKNLILAMAIYFCVAGGLSVVTSYLNYYIQTRNMRVRLKYIGELSKRLQTIDYCYHEDAKFFEEYQKGMEAGNNNSNGIEGLYNKMSVMPANFLTLLGMVIMAGYLSPVLLLAMAVHVIVTMWVSKLSHNYSYSLKEERSKASRRMGYYQRTTQDFSYGKDIRIFNLRQRIMDNYQMEINAHVKLLAMCKNREYLLGFLGLATLLITNLLTYGSQRCGYHGDEKERDLQALFRSVPGGKYFGIPYQGKCGLCF